jgi:hypothetical protein
MILLLIVLLLIFLILLFILILIECVRRAEGDDAKLVFARPGCRSVV